jgi:hypothetical protein
MIWWRKVCVASPAKGGFKKLVVKYHRSFTLANFHYKRLLKFRYSERSLYVGDL